ncbi:intermembrane transport protein PqiB [Paraburkholderia sp. GAS42]|uniref:PqiB family protein n=1 Tax=Paraburkholderia sp. GAS42 TaxID=3035135 RepID=UPI003D1CF1F5
MFSRRTPSSLIWFVPLAAALICIALAVEALIARGPTVTISFVSAEGLEPGKTKLRYRNLDIGSVKAIRLSRDHSRVLVDTQLTDTAKQFAVEDSRFWVVRPRIGTSGVSGLETVLSGAYIGVDLGRSRERRSQFVGLETPPIVTSNRNGRRYVLHGTSLGSIDIGSPVYYRHAQVGQVMGFSLDRDGHGVTIDVFVDAPYDRYVDLKSRWWHASGVDLQLDSRGFRLNTQSLATVLAGGIAFQQPHPNQSVGEAAQDGAAFSLADDEADAMRAPDGPAAPVVMKFDQSLRGLSVGATVDFHGIELGYVTAIDVEYDPKRGEFKMPVTMSLFPDRLGLRYRESAAHRDPEEGKALLRKLVARGLRGQLRTGNLLTNQRYVALDMFPNAHPVAIDMTRTPLELPTVPNTLEELQVQIADIAKKLDQVPFAEIGANLNNTLRSAVSLFDELNTELVPQARDTLQAAQQTFSTAQATLQQDAPLQADVREALRQLNRTLQTLNQLADYLKQHPESLLGGKARD